MEKNLDLQNVISNLDLQNVISIIKDKGGLTDEILIESYIAANNSEKQKIIESVKQENYNFLKDKYFTILEEKVKKELEKLNNGDKLIKKYENITKQINKVFNNGNLSTEQKDKLKTELFLKEITPDIEKDLKILSKEALLTEAKKYSDTLDDFEKKEILDKTYDSLKKYIYSFATLQDIKDEKNKIKETLNQVFSNENKNLIKITRTERSLNDDLEQQINTSFSVKGQQTAIIIPQEKLISNTGPIKGQTLGIYVNEENKATVVAISQRKYNTNRQIDYDKVMEEFYQILNKNKIKLPEILKPYIVPTEIKTLFNTRNGDFKKTVLPTIKNINTEINNLSYKNLTIKEKLLKNYSLAIIPPTTSKLFTTKINNQKEVFDLKIKNLIARYMESKGFDIYKPFIPNVEDKNTQPIISIISDNISINGIDDLVKAINDINKNTVLTERKSYLDIKKIDDIVNCYFEGKSVKSTTLTQAIKNLTKTISNDEVSDLEKYNAKDLLKQLEVVKALHSIDRLISKNIDKKIPIV